MLRELRRDDHCVSELRAYLVFITKYRREVITDRVQLKLKETFSEVCQNLDCSLIECNGEKDHIHLIDPYPPKISISILVNNLKGVSARVIKKLNYPEVRCKLWGAHFWSRSYFAGSCGGVTLETLKKYVENQGQE
jgi:putative transposase